MAKVSFRINKGLKDKNDKGQSVMYPDKLYPIYLRYRSTNVDYNVSLEEFVPYKFWMAEKEIVKDVLEVESAENINGLILKLKTHFDEWIRDNKRNGFIPSYQDVKRHYNSYFTISLNDTDEIELLDLFEMFIEQSPKLRREKVSSGTIKTYKTTRKLLEEFESKGWNRKLKFENIDLEFYFDFKRWCETSRNLSLNYIGKNIKVLKTIMSYALENGLTDNKAFLSKQFQKCHEDADNIYLSEPELDLMWKLNLENDEVKDRARDLFLIGSYTGLRISDFNKLKPEHIKRIKDIDIIYVPSTQKTGDVVAVPLHPIVRSILDKRNGQPPKGMADQKLNNHIKEIAESCGIDSIEIINITRGGKKQTLKKYKFELVKSHTARRSFCSNAYLAGMSPIDIMSISGHKTEKDFLNYIKLTAQDIAIKMSSHAFFKGN